MSTPKLESVTVNAYKAWHLFNRMRPNVISLSGFYKWVKAGRVTPLPRYGGHWVFPLSDVLKFIDRGPMWWNQ